MSVIEQTSATISEIAETIAAAIAVHTPDQQECPGDGDLPYLTLTYAQSIDGSISATKGVPTLLSGAESMTMTHTLRTLHDGILVGIGTILADNPSLNARLAKGKNPQPVVVDTTLKCPLSIKLFTSESCIKPILLCRQDLDEEARSRRCQLEAAGARILPCMLDERGHIDLRDAFARLRRESGIRSLMIEGGAAMITACLSLSAHARFIDHVVITIAPTFIGGLRAVTGPVHASPPFPRLQGPTYHPLGSDLVILGQL